jgi:hypothetical protein
MDESHQSCGPKIHGLYIWSELSEEQNQLTYVKINKKCWRLRAK